MLRFLTLQNETSSCGKVMRRAQKLKFKASKKVLNFHKNRCQCFESNELIFKNCILKDQSSPFFKKEAYLSGWCGRANVGDLNTWYDDVYTTLKTEYYGLEWLRWANNCGPSSRDIELHWSSEWLNWDDCLDAEIGFSYDGKCVQVVPQELMENNVFQRHLSENKPFCVSVKPNVWVQYINGSGIVVGVNFDIFHIAIE